MFLQPKAFLVDGVQPQSWEAVRNGIAADAAGNNDHNNRLKRSGDNSSSSSSGLVSNSPVLKTATTNTLIPIPLMRASREDELRRFEPKERGPLVRSAPPRASAAATGGSAGTQRSGVTAGRLPVTRTRPQPYQVRPFRFGLAPAICRVAQSYLVLCHHVGYVPSRWHQESVGAPSLHNGTKIPPSARVNYSCSEDDHIGACMIMLLR